MGIDKLVVCGLGLSANSHGVLPFTHFTSHAYSKIWPFCSSDKSCVAVHGMMQFLSMAKVHSCPHTSPAAAINAAPKAPAPGAKSPAATFPPSPEGVGVSVTVVVTSVPDPSLSVEVVVTVGVVTVLLSSPSSVAVAVTVFWTFVLDPMTDVTSSRVVEPVVAVGKIENIGVVNVVALVNEHEETTSRTSFRND